MKRFHVHGGGSSGCSAGGRGRDCRGKHDGIGAADSYQEVTFAKGSDKTTTRGTLTGRSPDARDYVVNVKAGQALAVELATKSTDTYFNA